MEEPYMGEEIPLRWLLFEKALATVDSKYMSLDQVRLQLLFLPFSNNLCWRFSMGERQRSEGRDREKRRGRRGRKQRTDREREGKEGEKGRVRKISTIMMVKIMLIMTERDTHTQTSVVHI